MRLGFGEILVVLALALLFFGPSKLPQLGNSLGQAIKTGAQAAGAPAGALEACGSGPATAGRRKGVAGRSRQAESARFNESSRACAARLARVANRRVPPIAPR